MTFTTGQRVNTPLGPGSVNYQRMDSATGYRDAAVVSVQLDDRPGDSHKGLYGGTIFRAADVTPIVEGSQEQAE
jgi:hypothetical protein